MYGTTELIEFLKNLSGNDNINPNSDIFLEVGMVGDDFHEMIEKYSKEFSVDMRGYLWYFHADEEGGHSLGGDFFAPPYKRVKRIPVTPMMLVEFANRGKWDMEYPEHTIPKRRLDLLINSIVLGILLVGVIVIYLLKGCK